MTQQRLQQLSDSYLEGTLSPSEWDELKAYLLIDDQHPRFQSELMKALEEKEYEPVDRGILEKILQKVFVTPHINEVSSRVPANHFSKTVIFRYAAAIIIVLGIGAYVWTTTKKPDQTFAGVNQQLNINVPPGGQKATLTLADGSKIILDDVSNGDIAHQGNSRIVKLANGQIAYDLKGMKNREVMWNTMSTPNGGQYQITLPDGTRVWLNASSSITFPTAFVEDKRNVKINGEVYFEVSANKEQPFIIDIGGKSLVEVLGTSFNINSYENENNIKATVLEGSVRVSNKMSKVVLKPGQQAITALTGNRTENAVEIIVKSNVDLDQTMAWKNGIFNFNGADLKTVMRQLERWYDVEVEYRNSNPNIIFRGEMYKNINLSDVLEMLEGMGVRFGMEGKKLIVY